MNSIKDKVQSAAQDFQHHNFKSALEKYQSCLRLATRNEESPSMVQNIKTAKGALESILGQHEKALETINQVLEENPYHQLAILRRSQIYKRMNKPKKALKDINSLILFAPDNLQISAFKIQIQNMNPALKNPKEQVSESSEEEIDQEEALKFSNLKQIDKRGVSIMLQPDTRRGRQSRVTISGDSAFFYDLKEEDCNQLDETKQTNSRMSRVQYAKEKYMQTKYQIQLDDNEEDMEKEQALNRCTSIICKPSPARSKSILKNRASQLFVSTDPVAPVLHSKRESKLIERLNNVDGNMIKASEVQQERRNSKEVGFRKSLFGVGAPIVIQIPQKPVENKEVKKINTKPGGRKSCLKRSSFENIQIPKSTARSSKFEALGRKSIDGMMIKSQRKSFEGDAIKQNISSMEDISDDQNNQQRSSVASSRDGSSYNIFGSREIFLSKQMKANLGISQNQEVKVQAKNKAPKGAKKSILKKDSLLFGFGSGQSNFSKQRGSQQSSQNKQKTVPKAKKSVMFNKNT